jgi:type IV pilus assembly protein PilX
VQEKMAGNTRDINIGFETAEGALRNGEGYIRSLTLRPVPCADCTVRTLDSLGDLANQDKDWWASNGKSFADGNNQAMTGVADNPRYVIEEVALVNAVPDTTDPQAARVFYQITARSTGASGLSNTIVQSTYARKY